MSVGRDSVVGQLNNDHVLSPPRQSSVDATVDDSCDNVNMHCME